MKKEILAIIPARGGSKGIPGKNLAPLDGKPLIWYTIQAAKGSKLITRIILSSDSETIIEYCESLDVEVPFRRRPELALDSTPMIDVVQDAVGFLRAHESYTPHLIIILQPTSPLRTSRHIDEALQMLTASDADSIVSVIEVPHRFNPYSVMKMDDSHLKPFLPYDDKKNLRHLKPKSYARNGPAICAMTYTCLTQKCSLYGERILPYLMTTVDSIDIDDPSDLKAAEAVISGRK